ncbi:MAG: hypothetical protein ACD_62C00647G0001 [uncultured bacterium]|nr:MAG: hypothetical protein ACD_62C00647G0001 [uncultured bacterium]
MTLAGRGLSLFPQTISQDEYLAMLGRQVQNQESLELAFHNDPSIQQMLSLSADLMERLEGLDAQIMAGTLGFTKDEDYLGALQAQAEYILSYFDENGETLRQVFEGSRETLQRLQGLNLGAQTDDFEQSIQKKIELLTQVEKMFIDSDELIERCQRLLEMTANFTEEQLLQWLKTDGVVFALSIAGAVLVLSGVGAVFGAGIFAGVGGMALSAVIMGAGSVFGQEVGLRVVSTYDARYQSLWQQATKGDITNDELWQGYVSNWGQQALMCFAFMGAGKLVGLGAKSMALSSRPALAGTGRALLSAGGSIQRTLNGIIPGEGAVANFWREYVSELFEESAEQTAQSIDPRLGAIVTTLNSMDGRNIEIAQINMGVTRKGIGVVDGAPVVEFEYEAGKHNEVFEDLKRRYEFSEQHRQELTDNGVTVQDRVRWAGPNVIEVTVPLQGADKTMTYRFTATQEPYFLRRAVAQRIRESQDGLRTHDDYLHDAVGIVPQQAQDVANAGREFRVAEGHTISEVQAAMKKLGFVPFDSNTESVDSYLLFETGNGVVTVYTTPVLQANSSTEKSAIESGPILEEGAVGEGVDQTTDVALAITPDEAGMQHFRTALDQTAQQIPDGTLETTVEIRVDNISDFDPMAVKQQIKEAFSETSVGRVTFVVYDGKTGVRAQQRIDINPEQVAKIPVKTFSADDGRRVAQQLMGDQFEQVQKTVLNWDPEYQERFWTEVARFKDKKQSADSLRPFLRSDSDGSTYGIVPPDTEQEITKRVVESTKVMDDFFSSLTVPMDKGSRSRRINAWPQDVRNFLDTYPPRPADWAQQGTPSSFVDSAGRAQEYFVPDYVVAKFDAWIAKHSFDVTTEVKGYFTTEKRGDVVYLTDFIPQPSMSESVEYHRSDYTSQEAFEKHFGGCQVASKSFPTIVGRGSAPLRDSFLQAVINPEHYVSKANPPDTIDVHSHFIESQFQNSPSTGDFVFFTQPIIMAVRTPNGGLLLFHPKKHLHSMVVAKPLSPAVLADPSVQHHLRATDPNSEFEVYFNPDAAEGERYRFVGSEVGRADMGETIIATDEEGHVTSKTRTDSATTPYGPEWQYVGHAHPSAEGHTVEPSQDDLIRFLQNGQKTHHILRFDPQTGETHWARITLHNTGEITITYSDPAMNTPEAQARFAQNLSDAQAFVADNSLKTGVKTGVKD